jgi:hypothetical protein
MIYDVVMFFVEKADQIKEFVDAVLDSVESIVGGGVGAVASKIENTLAKMLPVLIGFLASLLGLGGISEKVKKVIETVQKPINKAVDWVVGKAVSYGKRFLGFAGKMGKKIKGAAKKVGAKIKSKLGIKEKTPEQIEKDKQDRLKKGVSAGVAAANKFAGKRVAEKLLNPVLAVVKLRYRMKSLALVPGGAHWTVRGEVNPTLEEESKAAPPDQFEVDPQELEKLKARALQEKVTAQERHKKEGGRPKEVWASGNGQVLKQGAGEGPSGPTDASGVTHVAPTDPFVAAEMAKFSELGKHHDIVAMTTLTPEAKAKLSPLQVTLREARTLKDKAKKAVAEAEIKKVLRSASSYLHGKSYAGATKVAREEHSKKTGEWLFRRGGANDQGIPGYADMVHAEKMVYRTTGADAIGVSTLPQCPQCQLWFTAQAIADKKVIVVASDTVRVFLPKK